MVHCWLDLDVRIQFLPSEQRGAGSDAAQHQFTQTLDDQILCFNVVRFLGPLSTFKQEFYIGFAAFSSTESFLLRSFPDFSHISS